MSAVIKSGLRGDVRRFAGDAPEPVRQLAPVPDPRDAERERLLAEIARLEERCEEERAAAVRALEAAREKAYAEGLAAAETREAERLAVLGKELAGCGAAFAARLDVLDGLAPALVRAALAKLFADCEGWAAAVEAMLSRQLAALRRGSIVAVRVSPLDFPDFEALGALVAALGIEGVAIEPDRELRAGASRIECRLGQIDLDVRAQWQSLSALLAEMA